MMKNKTGGKLLVVDNDQGYRESLVTYLKIENFEADSAPSVEKGVEYLNANHCDLVLLDVRLRDHEAPDISGGEVAKKARELGIPCIMITAYPSTNISRIFLNSLSADPLAHDVVEKKDGPLAILTAIKTVLGRKGKHPLLEEPALVIDNDLGLVTLRGEQVKLPQKQYDLLLCLAKREGAVTGHREIIKAVYGETLTEGEARDDPRLERLVVRVRQKIEDDPARPRFLRTEKGRGYRLLVTGEEIPPESPG
jgi:two-component system KDP operon response regulator KdpE